MATDYLRVSQAARAVGVHGDTIRRWCDNGLVPAIRLPSGERRVKLSDLEAAMLEGQTNRAAS